MLSKTEVMFSTAEVKDASFIIFDSLTSIHSTKWSLILWYLSMVFINYGMEFINVLALIVISCSLYLLLVQLKFKYKRFF